MKRVSRGGEIARTMEVVEEGFRGWRRFCGGTGVEGKEEK